MGAQLSSQPLARPARPRRIGMTGVTIEVPTKEGFIQFRGYKVWYRTVGDREVAGKLPLLCLHGGPGASWDYLEPLEAVAQGKRCVVFYDQLGGGNSSVP